MTQIAESYRWCRDLCRRSSSNFTLSFRLLDPPRRNAMYALYAFARICDDLADSPQTSATNARASLEEWNALLSLKLNIQPESSTRSKTSKECLALQEFSELWPALLDTTERYDIPPILLQEIVQGVSMDLDHRQPDTWEHCEDYCYHVASAVGLACNQIWKSAEAKIMHEAAVRCGFAFQLTNILRDVAEDAAIGRIYLPKELLDEFNISADQWLERKPNKNWTKLIAQSAARAEEHYHFSWQMISTLTPQSQRVFSLMWRTYHSLLQSVLKSRERLWESGYRVRLRKRKKIILFVQHYITPLYQKMKSPCPQVRLP